MIGLLQLLKNWKKEKRKKKKDVIQINTNSGFLVYPKNWLLYKYIIQSFIIMHIAITDYNALRLDVKRSKIKMLHKVLFNKYNTVSIVFSHSRWV